MLRPPLHALLLLAALSACAAETSDMRSVPDRLAVLVDECRRSYPAARWVTLDEWAPLADAADATLLVDVRSPDEQAVSRIPDALTVEEYEALPLDRRRGATVLAYCTVGCRSGEYAAELEASGIDAYNLGGGVLSWALAGRSFVTPDGDETRRVHTYARRWAVVPPDYEAIY